MHRYPSYSSTRGFTLIEVIIVVIIIAILAAIALPAYTDYITRANRNVAKTALLEMASRMETFKLDNKTYVITDLTDLGYAADPIYFDRDGAPQAAAAGSIYQLDTQAVGVNTYTLQAVPQNVQANNDAAGASDDCATFRLDETGTKTVTGAYGAASCW